MPFEEFHGVLVWPHSRCVPPTCCIAGLDTPLRLVWLHLVSCAGRAGRKWPVNDLKYLSYGGPRGCEHLCLNTYAFDNT